MLKTTITKIKQLLLNEFIFVHVSGESVSVQTASNESILIPPRVEGILLDFDGEFVYIGDMDGIYSIIPFSKVVFFEIAKDIDERININEPVPSKGTMN